ncbi:MAG: hypothetical protein ACYTF0_04070 [Planctomycetota bacterium]|jgi:hypothetical protein
MFHGFYYTSDDRGDWCALALTERQRRLFAAMLGQYPPQALTESAYWRACYPLLLYQAPQGYVAWNGASYWLVAMPEVDEQGRLARCGHGLHVIRFGDQRLAYAYVDGHHFREPRTDADDPERQFCDTGMTRVMRALRSSDAAAAADEASVEVTLPEALAELVATPWYWREQGCRAADQRPLVAAELAALQANVGWTDALHARLARCSQG